MDDDTTDGTTIAGLPNVPGVDRHVQQVFGLRGINDAIYRREDRATFHAEVADNPNTPENEQQPAHTDPPDGRFDPIGSGTADMAVYQLADPQGSVVAVLADAPAVNPRLVDEVEYEPYGCRCGRRGRVGTRRRWCGNSGLRRRPGTSGGAWTSWRTSWGMVGASAC